MAGIPGTVGGAIRMNAGIKVGNNGTRAIYRGMGELVEEVGVISGKLGTFYILSEKELKFGYRDSNLKDSIILWAKMKKLTKDDKDEIAASVREFLGYKKKVQELNRPSAGCIFKNVSTPADFWKDAAHARWQSRVPPESLRRGIVSAGWLIDQADLKGKKIGGAQVSSKHGNFIVNVDNATAEDIVILTSIIKQNIRVQFGVQLEEEVEIVGI